LVILWPGWCAIEEGRLLEVGACTRNYGELSCLSLLCTNF